MVGTIFSLNSSKLKQSSGQSLCFSHISRVLAVHLSRIGPEWAANFHGLIHAFLWLMVKGLHELRKLSRPINILHDHLTTILLLLVVIDVYHGNEMLNLQVVLCCAVTHNSCSLAYDKEKS